MPNKKIKILFRHRSMEMGGVEKVLLSMLNHLNKDKFELTVLLNLNQGELKDEIPPHVKKISIAKGKEDMSKIVFAQKIELLIRRFKLNHFYKSRKSSEAKILNNQKFDIEIAMDWRDFEAVLTSPNSNSKKIAWFHSEVNIKGFEPLIPLVINSFPKFDQIIYCSEKIKDIIHEYHPDLKFPEETVITNAIPIEEIRKKAKEKISDFPKSATLKFVALGRLHTRKGFHTLLNVHSKLINDGLEHEIIILGDGEEKENLLLQRKNLGIEKTIHLLGNRMNPYAYLAKGDFFIMPSRSEAWPLVLAEALLLKKPVIATNVGDVSKIMKPNENGLLINYDEKEMYDAMKRFLIEPDLIHHINKNLENIDNDFDNQKIFNQVEDILTKLYQK